MNNELIAWVDGVRCHAHQKAALYAIAHNYLDDADNSVALTHRKIAKAGQITLRVARKATRRLIEGGIIEPVASAGIDGTHYRIVRDGEG